MTDAEMQRLLDDHKRHMVHTLPKTMAEAFPLEGDYLLALDAALPKLVEEVRGYRCSWARAHRVWAEDYAADESEMTDDEALAYYERETK